MKNVFKNARLRKIYEAEDDKSDKIKSILAERERLVKESEADYVRGTDYLQDLKSLLAAEYNTMLISMKGKIPNYYISIVWEMAALKYDKGSTRAGLSSLQLSAVEDGLGNLSQEFKNRDKNIKDLKIEHTVTDEAGKTKIISPVFERYTDSERQELVWHLICVKKGCNINDIMAALKASI